MGVKRRLLFHHSHDVLLLFRHHRNASWLAVFAHVSLSGKRKKQTKKKQLGYSEDETNECWPNNRVTKLRWRSLRIMHKVSQSFTVQTGLAVRPRWRQINESLDNRGKLGQSIPQTGYKWAWKASGAHVTPGRPICEIFHEAVVAKLQKKKKKNGDVLPAASLFHDLQLFPLVVEGLGQVAVLGDASDLRVVLELLPQLLVVVHGLPLSGGQLRGERRRVGEGKGGEGPFTGV